MRRLGLVAAVAIVIPMLACASAPGGQPPPGPGGQPPPGPGGPPPSGPAGPPSVAPAPPPVPADDDLDAVLWTQVAVEHDLLLTEVFRSARQALGRALADPTWDALPREDREGALAGLAPAVIVDVDETMLDNSPYQARLVRSGKEFDEYSWSEWCKEEAARPLPGALDFARDAAARGVAVYYISNRSRDLDRATLDNLRKTGFPVAGDEVFLGLGTLLPGCEQIGSDKGCRRRLVGRSHRVLMQLGDQVGDFVDVVANTPAGRAAAVEPYASWIGERWWVLPNPTYGSWEPATFQNDWHQSREARRRAKRDALREN